MKHLYLYPILDSFYKAWHCLVYTLLVAAFHHLLLASRVDRVIEFTYAINRYWMPFLCANLFEICFLYTYICLQKKMERKAFLNCCLYRDQKGVSVCYSTVTWLLLDCALKKQKQPPSKCFDEMFFNLAPLVSLQLDAIIHHHVLLCWTSK